MPTTEVSQRAAKSGWWVIAAPLALVTSLISFAMAPAAQQRSPAEMTRDLERLQAQITALEAQLADMGGRRETLVDEFESVDVRPALSRQRLELIRVRLEVLDEQSVERAAEVELLSGELETAREQLAARVVALYRMGPLSYSRFLLAADNTDEILSNYQLVGRLAAQDRSLVSSVRTRLVEHQRAVEQLEATTERLNNVRAEESRAVIDLTAQQTVRQELIRQIDIEAAAGRQALAEQEDSATALERLLGRVSAITPNDVTTANLGRAPAPSTTMPPAFATTRGDLPWPADGPVTLTFGRHRHPVYDTYTLSKGIEIRAPAGSSVRAVYQGRVQFSDWFQNYGLMVIVGHGNDFFTIYGHLDAVRVRTGEWVDAGGQVGTVGETGSLEGPSLYFEVREGQDAVNPERWLRRR